MDASDHNAAAALIGPLPVDLGVLLHLGHDLRLGHFPPVILVVQFLHTVKDLPLFESAVSDRRQHRIPVLKAVPLHNGFLIFGNYHFRRIDGLRLTVTGDQLLAFYNIVFF